MKKKLAVLFSIMLMASTAFAQFGGSPFSAASHVLIGDLTMQNGEIISNSTDGIICLVGSEDICFDLNSGGANVVRILSNTSMGILNLLDMSIYFDDYREAVFGTSNDAIIGWQPHGTNDLLSLGLTVGSAAQSGYFVIVEQADINHANCSPVAAWPNGVTPADPTFCVYSADATTVADCGCQWHDQTDYNIASGTGNIVLAPASNIAIKSGNLLLDNNQYFQMKTAAGAGGSILNVSGSDAVNIGDIFNAFGGDVVLKSGGASTMTLTATGNVMLGDTDLTAGPFQVSPPATETIAGAATITANACGTIKKISSAGVVTTNTTNTFTAPAAANEGCCMDVINVNAADTITLDTNANFKSAGAANVVLGSYDTCRVCSTGASGKWVQMNPTGNN